MDRRTVVSPVRLMLIFGTTAGYLGLAVLGWGGVRAFFSHPALLALAISTFALSGAAFFAGGSLSRTFPSFELSGCFYWGRANYVVITFFE